MSPVTTQTSSEPIVQESSITFGGKANHTIPNFTDMYEKRKWMLNHMAAAFRVFARKDYAEGQAGHISIRDPVDRDTFWINPLGVHFAMLKAEDMVHVNEMGEILPDGNQLSINHAGFCIHSEIHKARPDVDAACHTHSIYGKAYSTFGKPLEMISQDSCLFYNAHAVYEGFGGVVLDGGEGKHIAAALGSKQSVILQNHGILTTGRSVDEAAFMFIAMEKSCQAQLLADAAANQSKPKRFIEDREAAFTYNATVTPFNLYSCFQPEYSYEISRSNGDI
ncbi:arad-like aldolase/epimerase [Nadsonia fulvescens var. elongata DSM 6958]|uniref:Arad-like aldolase/epimerase n=1 Tax=Nadsonia fulvescens var. elongata DSM 6958 TaxID=857566 RepID=A0A1E3PDA8_9ASCO|nr:arad-like aldolase/epimerase [Nadsonia fulvescens var. elongata DSM 6958]